MKASSVAQTRAGQTGDRDCSGHTPEHGGETVGPKLTIKFYNRQPRSNA